MSLASKGKPKSKQHKRNMSIAMKGRKCPWVVEFNKKTKPELMRGDKNPSKRLKIRILLSQLKRGLVTSPNTLFKSGELNPAWKGGISSEIKKIRVSKKYISWRKSIFERDNYICQNCGAHNGNGKNIYLTVHHIEPFSKSVEKRFDINNGITLCLDCHKNTLTWGKNI